MKMKRTGFSLLLVVLALSLLELSPLARSRAGSPAFLQTQHGALLQQWLKGRPQLRLATEADCTNREGLRATRQEYGQSYQPYYTTGDFNRDGKEDVAVVLINKQRRSRKFAIAIFNGQPAGKAAVAGPAFYRDGVDLSDGGLIWRTDNRLLAGTFQTDNCIILEPRGRSYVIKDCF